MCLKDTRNAISSNFGDKLPAIALIGSARLEDTKLAAQVFQLGKQIALSGFNLVCGGLGGIMKEGCKGFKSVDTAGKTIGILPSYDINSANKYIDIAIPTGLDIGRNQLVVSSGIAVVAVSGGAGTLSEIAIASQINKPIILLKGSGGWADKIHEDFLDERNNAEIFHADSVDLIIEILNGIICLPDRTGTIGSDHNR